MPLTLTVDGPAWRAHLRTVEKGHPGLVPVAKGNGYGFGVGRLARRAAWLGVDTLAVGTYDEVAGVSSRFGGKVLVLSPWRDFERVTSYDDPALTRRLIHTVSRPGDLPLLLERSPRARFVLELLTSMKRHGMTPAELRELRERCSALGADTLRGLRGIAVHLPLAQGSHLGQLERLLNAVVAARLPTRTIFVSHLTDDELRKIAKAWPDYTFRPRIGTDLWLGDRSALRVTATVLDVHPVERGDVFGYRGRTAPKSGHLLVVSGGTAHGIGLEAPLGELSLRSRAASIARGGMDAVGFVRSPYIIDGKHRLFAEPPHMQASMLFLPTGAHVPAVGDEVDVRVRYTATDVDRVTVT